MPKIYFVSVDVGTAAARAGLITSDGKVLKQSSNPIRIWNPENNNFEQSSENIWQAVRLCVAEVIKGVHREEIASISFDATCSLVILGEHGEPLSVSNTRNPEQNVILWMDHRAVDEAQHINATAHDVLKYCGGQVSLEMEMPKLLWLKRNAYLSTWTKLWRAFDLADYLTWRCTGCDKRSLCTVVCKWNYDATAMAWNREFLQQIDMDELSSNDFEKIGQVIVAPGEAIADGLSVEAAADLGLLPGTVVSTSLIDAHAGALGMFGCRPKRSLDTEHGSDVCLETKLAVISGTSTCHLSLTRQPCWASGIWGPYRGAIVSDYHLNEGGQSATGLLLDHVIRTHPQYMHIKMKLKENIHMFAYLNEVLRLISEKRGLEDPCFLTENLHVWPDFHGNRSPMADDTLKGMICGLHMDTDEESLAILYLAFVQALAYGTRHIIEVLQASQRVPFQTLLFCGGLSKNKVYVQSHADICQLPAVIPIEQEMVLVGSAMLGACAAKVYENLEVASAAMGGYGNVLQPNDNVRDYHNRKYRVFQQMLDDQCKYKRIMTKK